jgi:hypothetical protein
MPGHLSLEGLTAWDPLSLCLLVQSVSTAPMRLNIFAPLPCRLSWLTTPCDLPGLTTRNSRLLGRLKWRGCTAPLCYCVGLWSRINRPCRRFSVYVDSDDNDRASGRAWLRKAFSKLLGNARITRDSESRSGEQIRRACAESISLRQPASCVLHRMYILAECCSPDSPNAWLS